VRCNVPVAEATQGEAVLPERARDALGQLVGAAKQGLLASRLHRRDACRRFARDHQRVHLTGVHIHRHATVGTAEHRVSVAVTSCAPDVIAVQIALMRVPSGPIDSVAWTVPFTIGRPGLPS
jgi:hypothetical protein